DDRSAGLRDERHLLRAGASLLRLQGHPATFDFGTDFCCHRIARNRKPLRWLAAWAPEKGRNLCFRRSPGLPRLSRRPTAGGITRRRCGFVRLEGSPLSIAGESAHRNANLQHSSALSITHLFVL